MEFGEPHADVWLSQVTTPNSVNRVHSRDTIGDRTSGPLPFSFVVWRHKVAEAGRSSTAIDQTDFGLFLAWSKTGRIDPLPKVEQYDFRGRKTDLSVSHATPLLRTPSRPFIPERWLCKERRRQVKCGNSLCPRVIYFLKITPCRSAVVVHIRQCHIPAADAVEVCVVNKRSFLRSNDMCRRAWACVSGIKALPVCGVGGHDH